MLLALLLQPAGSAEAIRQDALRQLEQARTITLTQLRTNEEFPSETRTRYWFRKGGYFRAESGTVTDVANPKQGWTYRADQKIYQARQPLPTNFSLLPVVGLDTLQADMPIIGGVRKMKWHNRATLRIELDGRRLTKETKLFVFFDPKSHLPVGISANLGSITQVIVFENLKIDPKIDDKMFQFTPPKGWRRVMAGTGGWD